MVTQSRRSSKRWACTVIKLGDHMSDGAISKRVQQEIRKEGFVSLRSDAPPIALHKAKERCARHRRRPNVKWRSKSSLWHVISRLAHRALNVHYA